MQESGSNVGKDEISANIKAKFQFNCSDLTADMRETKPTQIVV